MIYRKTAIFIVLSTVFLDYAFAVCTKSTKYHENPEPGCVKTSEIFQGPCQPGCYCPGGDYKSLKAAITGLGYSSLEMTVCCELQADKCKEALEAAGVFYCPSGYKISEKEAKSITDCYNSDGVHYTSHFSTITCSAGEYIPKGKKECTSCKDLSGDLANNVCPGGTWKYDTRRPNTVNIGLQECESGTTPNADHTKCITQTEENSKTIAPCYYLPANSMDPRPCTSTHQYCPGGTFQKKGVDQGKYPCPYNGTVTPDCKTCAFKLTKEQMRNGITGNGKCWTKTDPDDYKKCIYGM